MRVTSMLLLALALTSCGTTTGVDPTLDTETAAELPFATTDGEMLVSCWGRGPGWPVAAMDGGAPGLVDDNERDRVDAAIRAYATEMTMGDPEGPWIPLATGMLEADDYNGLLEEDAETLVVGTGTWAADGPGEDGRTIELARIDDGFRPISGGDCVLLAPVLDGHAEWVELSDATIASPDALGLRVRVHERGCTSARDPRPHLDDPTIVETTEAVTVYLTSEPPGEATCPGNPTVQHRIELPSELAGRALLDGSTWPPTELVAATGP